MAKINKNAQKKPQHITFHSKGLKNTSIAFNTSVVIKTKGKYLFTEEHREVCRRIFSRTMKESGRRINIRFFPDVSKTKKPLQVRMGKGKGRHDHWVAQVKSNRPLMEINGLGINNVIRQKYKKLAVRLPVFSKLLCKPRLYNYISKTTKKFA